MWLLLAALGAAPLPETPNLSTLNHDAKGYLVSLRCARRVLAVKRMYVKRCPHLFSRGYVMHRFSAAEDRCKTVYADPGPEQIVYWLLEESWMRPEACVPGGLPKNDALLFGAPHATADD